MDVSKSKTNRKRRLEYENGLLPSRKSQQINAERQRLDSQEQPTKITDLIDDCLEKIFEDFGLNSLFNVAVANEYLRPAAGAVYKRKFGTERIHIRYHFDPDFGFVHHDNGITIRGLRTCLQYLRCFGSSISDLCIRYYGWNEKQCEHIHHYVNKYCAESLVKIEFRGNSKLHLVGQFKDPFVNVHAVKVLGCDLGNQLTLFQQWFPNMHTLDMPTVQVYSVRRNGMPFQHLQDLRIDVNSGLRHLTATKASSLLKLCPQLQSLEISGQGYALKKLLDLITDNRAIRELTLSMRDNSSCVNHLEIQQIVNEHPALVKLELGQYILPADGAISLIRQLNSLNQFRFQIDVSNYDQLVGQLDIQWQRRRIFDCVELRR